MPIIRHHATNVGPQRPTQVKLLYPQQYHEAGATFNPCQSLHPDQRRKRRLTSLPRLIFSSLSKRDLAGWQPNKTLVHLYRGSKQGTLSYYYKVSSLAYLHDFDWSLCSSASPLHTNKVCRPTQNCTTFPHTCAESRRSGGRCHKVNRTVSAGNAMCTRFIFWARVCLPSCAAGRMTIST